MSLNIFYVKPTSISENVSRVTGTRYGVPHTVRCNASVTAVAERWELQEVTTFDGKQAAINPDKIEDMATLNWNRVRLFFQDDWCLDIFTDR